MSYIGERHWEKECLCRDVILMQSQRRLACRFWLYLYARQHCIANKGDTAEEIFEKMMDVLRSSCARYQRIRRQIEDQ